MAADVRTLLADELDAFLRVASRHAARAVDEDETAEVRSQVELDRCRVASDGERIVGTALTLPVELTAPGPTILRAALLTGCAVLPTHRRRGLLSAMLTDLLDDAERRGEPIALLGAADSAIYGRFGFGLASLDAGVRIDCAHGAFTAAASELAGAVRLIDRAEAAEALPSLFDRWRREQPGAVLRHPESWAATIAAIGETPDRADGLVCAVHERDGVPDGYVTYRLRPGYAHDGTPDGEVAVEQLVALSAAATAALWRHCLDTDLCARVTMAKAPLDEPLRWLLAAPRALMSTRVVDGLWLRLLDVPRALAERGGYPPGHELVLDVVDDARPRNAGRHLLRVAAAETTCTPTDRPADVRLGVDALASLYLGGVHVDALARGGRAHEDAAGGLERTAAVFATGRAPHCNVEL